MKKIFIFIVVDIFLLFYVFYVINFSNNDIKMGYLPDVYEYFLSDGIEKLRKYEVAISYIDGNYERDKIIYTYPKANSIVYDNQIITLYVSKGNADMIYRNLENQMYEEVKDYINEIKETYNLNVIISYKEDKNLLDGLIYEQIIDNMYIDYGETVEYVIGKNIRIVKLPNFIGWHFESVIKFANENGLRIEFEYVPILYQEDFVIGQSIQEGTSVLKNNNNPIVLYLAKDD